MNKNKAGIEKIEFMPETTNLENVEEKDISKNDKEKDTLVLAEKPSEKIARVNEIPELRAKNKKVFRMSDGSEQAVFFPAPIHSINNKTCVFEEEIENLAVDNDGKHFVCKKNGFSTKFNNQYDSDELFSIEEGEHRVTVLCKKNDKFKNKANKPEIIKKQFDNVKSTNVVAFKDVEVGTDLEYSVERDGIKENIVVKEAKKEYRYPFTLKCDNVTPMFDQNSKRIAFLSTKTGKEVFFIPAPFMYDAKNVVSPSVFYEMETLTNGDTLLTVIADSDWMNAEERVFPVTIDPQIKLSGVSDMMTYSWKDGCVYTSETHTIGNVVIMDENQTENDDSESDSSVSLPVGALNAVEIYPGSGLDDCICCPDDEKWYKFTANTEVAHYNGGKGVYAIFTLGSLDTVGYLYDSNGNLVASNDNGNGTSFYIVKEFEYDHTYYICVKGNGYNTGDFQLRIGFNIAEPTIDNNTEPTITCCCSNRMYMQFNMPTLPRNPRIKKAELKFFQKDGIVTCGETPRFGLYHVTEDINIGNYSPLSDPNLIDYAVMKTGHIDNGKVISYSFDITALVDMVNKTETYSPRLVLKMIDECESCNNNITLYGSSYGVNDYMPQLVITYESNYGVNTSYRTNTHELGRFGQGSIDLQCGNLMFESEDFAWAGNRMPVTIKHLYNSALADYQYSTNTGIALNAADFSAMKIGNGYKLNIMQSMVESTFQHNGELHKGYVYIGENGDETFFKESSEVCCDSNSQCYKLYEDVNDGGMIYDECKHTLKQGDDIYQFDESGRLISITDAYNNCMTITYTSGRITSVADGVGRVFNFEYNNKYLTKITAPDGTFITYSYDGDHLAGVTYQDGRSAELSYLRNKPSAVILKDVNGNDIYRICYSFGKDRLASVTEFGVEDGSFVDGPLSSYNYSAASRMTRIYTTQPDENDDGIRSDSLIITTYTFDDDGNVISEYVFIPNTGNVGVDGEESGVNPHSADGGMGVVSNINNLLKNHSFESNLAYWYETCCNCGNVTMSITNFEAYSKYGQKALVLESNNSECAENGVYQLTGTLPKGQYTLSSYIRVLSAFTGTANPGAYLRVKKTDGTVLAESEHLSSYDTEYIRLIAPFELETAQPVQVEILLDGKGRIYADAAQLENNPYANAYNMLENGNFEQYRSWSLSSDATYTNEDHFNMSKSLMITGGIDSKEYARQSVKVTASRSTRETFTLSGWAKGYGLPSHEKDSANAPTFRLRAKINYSDFSYGDYTSEEFTADFSPCTDEWQFASIEFAKSKYRLINNIEIFCDYDYNVGKVYFDDIQLVRNSIEKGLSSTDFDTDTADTVTEDTSGEENTTDTATEFEELKDAFGNILTETTFTDGEFGSMYRSFAFGNDSNDLAEETDARGYRTLYDVDENTSRNKRIVDRCDNITDYEYDEAGRTTKVTSRRYDEQELANVSYKYDAFDNMTEIIRGDGMKYVLNYNAFHNLESIGVDGKGEKLVTYDYKNGNGRLKQITYANGDCMKASYNGAGQMTAEKWYNACSELTAHYKYVYDGEGNIVRSIDILSKKEYNYTYENGKIIRATESDIEFSGEFVTSKVLVNTIRYYYDTEDKLTKKVIIPAVGSEQTIYYENNDDNTVIKFSAGGKTVTSHSKTDSFGRKVFDELQLGTGFVSRQFHYHTGAETTEHVDNDMLKSSPTTQLVSQIVLSGGRTLSYEYDKEERITQVVDSLEGTTKYTYDELGQLETETKNGIKTRFEYDNYGNIVAKGVVDEMGEIEKSTRITYMYGDDTWKDLLTSYNGKSITYDTQGNPTNYLGHQLTWEKGRQLKSFDGNTYTYNANGIRTSKTVDGVRHDYVLDGAKIVKETWGENTLVPLYDNEDSVCGVIYNNEPFYFHKNLQGDIIAIVNKDAETVARYSYDAWGKCTTTYHTDFCCIACINPYRYRGYYFDNEIGLYYVSSRYYDPEIGRFISADEPMLLAFGGGKFGYNLFSYCENNPINQKDTNGYIAANIVGAAIGAIIGVVGGVFLGNWLADVLKLSGWKRGIFVAAVAALVGAAAGAIGYFIGPYVAKIATKLGHYVLDLLKKGKIAFRKLSNSVKSSIRTLGKCACFVAGTLVLTERGLVPIEEIVPGDKVWSENTSTGETGYKGVVKTFVNQVNTLVKLKFAEEEIKTTMNHPFWVVGSGWKSASKLQSGDKVKHDDGTMVDVLGVEIVYLDTPVNVYNFEVADWHTYFVGNTSILVHNMCAKEFVRSPKNAKQVLKYLKEQGFTVASQNGSHIKLTDGLKTVIVPDHGAKNIAIGTLRSIMKQAGLL